MKIEDVISEELISEVKDLKVIGIDIGSRTGKAVLLSEGNLYVEQIATGIYMQETAEELIENLLEKSGIDRKDIQYIVGTGYGRIALRFDDIPHEIVTEISCHAMGAHFLNSGTKTIIDIGGQDSKAIKVDTKTGKVAEFIMNDKCAAGTGRFIEKVAGLLDYSLDEIGEESLKSQKVIEISSQCVVFAESEIISLKARGEDRRDIAAGIHFAAAKRVRNLINRIGLEPELVFSGGVSNNVGMKHALEVLIGHPIKETKLDMIYAGALGAAIYAQKNYSEHSLSKNSNVVSFKLNLDYLKHRIEEQHEIIADKSIETKKVGYLCSYTPVELINASGAIHTRLFKAGDPDTVSVGEIMTKSVFCDLTKSCLGSFKTGDPLHNALDKVYTFYTCDSMKKVAEAINENFIPTDIYLLPRNKERDESRQFFKKELINFKNSLENLTGKKITEDDLRGQIVLYNKNRALLKKISDLRKRNNPPLTGQDFLELTKAAYYLPPEEQLQIFTDLYEELSAVPDNGVRPIRIMMTGGIVGDGDRRLLEIVENEIGARIVVEDHCSGLSPFYYQISENEDPYLALADGYLNQAPCARMSPLEDRIDFSGKLAKEYDVDAVLFTYLKFCPCYGITKNNFLRYFQSLGLPVLELPIDYSRGDEGQIKTRVEAFIEVLSEKGSA